MFYRRFDDLSAILLKKFNTKKTLQETADQFNELAKQQNQDNPFEQGMVALAYFGEMQCYEKLEDKQKIIRTSIKAARLFIKSASFNFEISRAMRDSWSDPLANGIHCYKTAINYLVSDNKPNLAVSILFELGQAESRFEFHHYAGNTYEDALDFCIKHQLRPRLLSEALLYSIRSYVKADRLDLSYLVCEKGYSHFSEVHSGIISSSKMMHEQFMNLSLLKTILMICNRKYDEAILFSTSIFSAQLKAFLQSYSSASQESDINALNDLYSQISQFPEFEEIHIQVLEKHKILFSKTMSN